MTHTHAYGDGFRPAATRTMIAWPRQEDLLVDELAGLARAYAESQAFVSLLAHELRTQLKLTERALSSAGADGLETARDSTRTVQELVETILELERNQPAEPADTGAALCRALNDLRPAVEHLQAEIVVSKLPPLLLPQGLVEIVLRNLVVNALEAGASRIEVFARPDRTICVRDNGPGVALEQAATIFGVYSSKLSGGGLGLKLCREILRRRGGDIWLELPSTFSFRSR